jgi:hypothetical protein
LGRICVDCRRSLADRHRNAYLCRGCARARRVEYARRRSRELYRDAALAEKRRAYASAWNRAKRAKQPDKILSCADGCGRTFTERRGGGRRRKFAIECAMFHEGYTSRSAYLAKAKRRSKNARLRRAA